MNDTLNRLKKIAGIVENTQVIDVNPPINVEARVRMAEEYEFHIAAKKFGAYASSINDTSGRLSGRASFKGANAAETLALSEAFLAAWKSGNFDGVINEKETTVDACSIEASCENNEASSQEESTEDLSAVNEGKKGDLYFLYVGVKGSGKLGQQFSDESSAACHQEYRDSWTNEYDDNGKKIKYAYRVVKGSEDVKAPTSITESLDEGHTVVKGIDKEKYQEREGLEGPFSYKNGKVYYYDKKEGKDYDPDTDRYIDNEDRNAMNEEADVTNFTQQIQANDNKLSTRTGADADRAVVVKIPKSIKASVAKRIKELEASIEQYDEKGYNEVSQKEKAIKCLNQIMDNLAVEDIEGVKQAQIFFGTLMSPITDLFPAPLVTFLAAPTYGYDTESGWLDKFK